MPVAVLAAEHNIGHYYINESRNRLLIEKGMPPFGFPPKGILDVSARVMDRKSRIQEVEVDFVGQ